MNTDQKYKTPNLAMEDNKQTLMSWSIKSINQPPSSRKLSILACIAVPGICFTYALWVEKTKQLTGENSITPFLSVVMIVFALYAIVTTRQKTIFNYRIYADKGEQDFCLYFPEYAGSLLKGIVLFLVLACVGVAIYTGSLLMLFLGPAGVVFGAGGKLLTWEPPTPVHVPSLPWTEHKFVTVDRKYRIVVTHREDPTVGFEARFPNNELMEQYLAFLRTVLPADVRYNEEVWKW